MLSFEPFEGRFVRDGFSRVLFWLVLDLGVDAAMYVGASIENVHSFRIFIPLVIDLGADATMYVGVGIEDVYAFRMYLPLVLGSIDSSFVYIYIPNRCCIYFHTIFINLSLSGS
ncbi:uncharacterized protein LOC142180342 isoform X1 [Nicotiana tabacum]|uniref:Uncharacterized protein LOC142180342 isoform X1 n=2 Tax=Nicotiana tabacum TaxID=4097 RepID=A0AC58UFK2_TOBAC|nr:uncharacterized protein LOC104092146 isoform X1 [Nicotiana tomentosiformis]